MASFDLRRRRICLRVVYDGAAGAGKTTNVRQLAKLFQAQLASSLYSPAEIEGRTLYFDWLQILGGLACGFPLVCQVIGVPGQRVLEERRQHLLSTADAVVYVCDSADVTLERDRDALHGLELDFALRKRPPLLLIQANKQDAPGARTGVEVLQRLGRTELPCIEAIASDSIGIVDTFVAAVRAVTMTLQQAHDKGDLELDVVPPENAGDLLSALERVPVDPEWAAEMFLEEVSRALRDGGTQREPTRPKDPGAPRVRLDHAPPPRGDAPDGCVWPAHIARTYVLELAALGLRDVRLDSDGVARERAGMHRLHTSRRVHFQDEETARRGLVRTARAWSQLDTLRSPRTALVLQPADDGTFWLWTLVPDLMSVETWLEEPAEGSERLRRQSMLADCVAALRSFSTSHDALFEVGTEHLGVEDGTLRYVGSLDTGSTVGA